MRGIILAAGKGSRLNGTAGESPKCLVEAGGVTLLERQIRALCSAPASRTSRSSSGVRPTGCGGPVGTSVTYVENARYAQTNSMYSLWMARPLLYEGFVVLNCDVLFHPVLLDDLLSARHENALLLAYREADQPAFGDEEMKVKVRCGRVVEMSKTMDPAEADGENLGIVKFGPGGRRRARRHHGPARRRRRHRATGRRAPSPSSRRRTRCTRSARAAFPWIEIDFPADYQRAVREVLPENRSGRRASRIAGRCAAAGTARPIAV